MHFISQRTKSACSEKQGFDNMPFLSGPLCLCYTTASGCWIWQHCSSLNGVFKTKTNIYIQKVGMLPSWCSFLCFYEENVLLALVYGSSRLYSLDTWPVLCLHKVLHEIFSSVKQPLKMSKWHGTTLWSLRWIIFSWTVFRFCTFCTFLDSLYMFCIYISLSMQN